MTSVDDRGVSHPGRLKLALAGVAAAGVGFLIWRFDVQDLFRQALHWVDGLGGWGPAAFVGIYIVACVLLLPGSVLTLGAGVVFGLVKGVAWVSAGATLGATAAFLTGRYLAREWVSRKIAGNGKFHAVDEAVAREGWKIVLLTRLSPVFPFNVLNYAYGLTRVSLRDYFWASWVGMLPGTILYVYLGSLAGGLAGVGTADRSRSAAEWVFFTVGLLAALAVSVYVTRVARRALREKIS
jgi:uncharacterized membrane protein YdjX (TVP38/TMEM64 family)